MPNPIRPVKVVTSSDLEQNGGVYLVKKGMAARPVYGFTAQGNRAAKGVAYPVYVVSDAEFAAGDFVKGRGEPIPVGDIDDLGYQGALPGREAIPVYAVNDWPQSGVTPFVGAYDDIPDLVHVYEPARRTLTSYGENDPLVRLRRDSDDAEMDFGSIANGDLDTTAIATWLGGANGFVVTVYDQVGSNNLTQATAGNQPTYTASGQNSKPVMTFDGSADYMAVSLSTSVTQPVNFYFMAKLDTAAVNAGFKFLVDGQFSSRMVISQNNSSPDNWRISAGVGLDGGTSDDNANIWSVLFNGASSEFWINGSSEASGDAGTAETGNLYLGRFQSSVSNLWDGEVGMWAIADPSHDNTERGDMETAINDYWGAF